MATSHPARRIGLSLVAVAGLTLASSACGDDATDDSSPSTQPAPAADGADAPSGSDPGSGSVQRGGWDGNSNEPFLADSFR